MFFNRTKPKNAVALEQRLISGRLPENINMADFSWSGDMIILADETLVFLRNILQNFIPLRCRDQP